MPPDPPPELTRAIARWASLSRWERAELRRALRRRGWSYGEIRTLLPVPAGTLAGWCRGIRLTDEQVMALRARTTSARGVPRDTQRTRRAQVERIRAEARAFAAAHLHDPLFVAGTVLYWGEGAKTSPRLALSNADVDALRVFMRWVRAFHRPAAAFVLSLHLHEGNDDDAARRWWARQLDLSDADFTKTYVNPRAPAIARTICATACVASSCAGARMRGTRPWRGSASSRPCGRRPGADRSARLSAGR